MNDAQSAPPPGDGTGTPDFARPTQSSLRNGLLASLPARDFALLAPFLQRTDLPARKLLIRPGEPITDGYFLEEGIGSIVAISPEGNRVEIGLFGCDAASPTALILGTDRTPHEHFVQVPGFGYRIAAAHLADVSLHSPALVNLLLRYAQTISVQTAFTALSNAIHAIDVRLARWMLMIHDRQSGDDIPITHELMAVMLAVRRPSVTTALHVLEGERLIRAERGSVTIRDRPALEAFAGDAYGKPEAEYLRLIGPMKATPDA